ncbi:MAG: hypothetical protein M3R01_00105 [Actinomycetota bacterium]|nr:hypothetical protein [Actinomycetota bacterium]
MALRDYLATEIAQDCTDGLLTRKESLRRLGLLGFSLASASATVVADEAAPGEANQAVLDWSALHLSS